MTLYPFDIDDDQSLIRVDDNLSEIGSEAINQIRSAIFAIEEELGIHPAGSAGSVAERLDKSLTADGDIKASALTSIGLVTLPITNSQVAFNAGIIESKLSLDFSTSNLHTLILSSNAILNSLASFAAITNADLLAHISGATFLTDGSTPGRHVASQIDLNAVPSDPRDPAYVWTGLFNKEGVARTATTVVEALLQINNDLVDHENAIADAHVATAISVDTSDFTEIPAEANTVQKALQALDDSDRLQIGDHRQTMHSNGVPRHARSEQLFLDGYSQNIVPVTPVSAFLVRPPATMPVDSNTQGDDIIKFNPTTNVGFVFDSQFAQVKDGDIVTINYGIGLATSFMVESIRFIPNSDWTIRINGTNLFNTDGYNATARIDRPAFDIDTYGVLAVAAANNNVDASIIGSVVVGSPRGATALGLEFDADQIDSTHYNLYLQLYPSGNPTEYSILLPAIDVSGNAGITPGQYTIDIVVENTNNALRAAGYNYRFIAFSKDGEFGIMLADPIGSASFSIISGIISGSSVITGGFLNNVVGDASTSGFDSLGFGINKAALASPQYVATFASQEAASTLYTKLIAPLRRRNYVSNGVRRDTFAPTYLANADGYWDGYISQRTVVGTTTVETLYTINLDLSRAGLSVGKTIVIQPTVGFTDPLYHDSDYGRFIIKSISFVPSCNCSDIDLGQTIITVINGVHGSGNPIGFSSDPFLNVRLYFGEDSVGFNASNVIDAASSGILYKRFHEIYISGEGNTFSHERARMPKQTETSSLLATTGNWFIKNVSPKLRGFIPEAASAQNKYIRFYILSYDSGSGIYDGYIGQVDLLGNTSKNGNITVARKNVPSRFYDETNVDYIEMEFFDSSASAGTDIMSTNSARYVDIEIFPSLELDDENMLLATCELNNTVVEEVVDRRSFGNTSEVDFTQSAIDFITSGDRHLHENGIISGMDFIAVSSADPRLLNFKGGLVLVNGHTLAINNESVAIPEIRLVGASLPASVTWAVCINETGQYEPIIITSSKIQYFATTGTGSYYVPSVTWNELIVRRKDLVVIALVDAVINSITLTVHDARRYVTNVGYHDEFVLCGDDEQYPGSFKSLDSVIRWCRLSNADRFIIKVRGGDINLSSDDMLALTDFNGKTIIFDGTDSYRNQNTTSATFILTQLITFAANVTFKNIDLKFESVTTNFSGGTTFENCTIQSSATSFDVVFGDNILFIDSSVQCNNLGSLTFFDNITAKNSRFNLSQAQKIIVIKKGSGEVVSGFDAVFEDCTFTYNPGGGLGYTVDDHVNINTICSAIIVGTPDNTLGMRNFRVERCTFNCTLEGNQRPPFIGFIIKNGDVLDNIIIRDNKFNDTVFTQYMCAMVVVHLNFGGSTSGGIISNSRISNNACNQNQSFILTTSITTNNPDINAPGLHAVNTIIDGNACGNIGFVTSSDHAFDSTLVPIANGAPGLIISNNTCRLIANLDDLGNYKFTGSPLGFINHNTGDVAVCGNSANWINCAVVANSYGISRAGTLLLDGNKLQAYDPNYLLVFKVGILTVAINDAILVTTNSNSTNDNAECRIVNNTSDFGFFAGSEYGYDKCVYVNGVSCIVSDNIFRGIKDSVTNSVMGAFVCKEMLVANNRFSRVESKVLNYIQATRSDGYGMIVDNIFDHPTTNDASTIDALNLLLVNYSACPRLVVEKNINQSVIQFINPANGNFSISPATADYTLIGLTAPGALINYNFTAGLVIKFVYDVAATPPATGTNSYRWLIATEDILPKNVKIIGASSTLQADAVCTTTGAALISIATGASSISSITAGNALSFIGAYVPNTPLTTAVIVGPDTAYITGYDTYIALDVFIATLTTTTVSCALTYILYRW